MKVIVSLIILIVFYPIPIGCADWQLVAENKINKFYIDKESISQTSNNSVKAWFKTVPNISLKLFDKYMSSQIVYEEENCEEHTIRFFRVISNYSDGTSEEVISEPCAWFDVPINTIFEMKHEYLCKGKKMPAESLNHL
jgi:hypothetical protein